jgi:hypothetical protein
MTRKLQGGTTACLIGLAVLSLVLMGGCSGSQVKSSGSSKASASGKKGRAPVYYDFGDVLIPKELKINKKQSFVVESSGVTAGVLVLKGYVELNSLIAFFQSNMAKDNWEQISAFKSPRTILLFGKTNRRCVINITESTFNTEVEIWVAPTVAEGQAGLLKE